MTPIQAGTPWPLEILIVDSTGARVVGLPTGALVVDIRCTTPGSADAGKLWDFADESFKASGWTTRRAELVEVDATTAPGVYALPAGWSTTGLTGSFTIVYDLASPVDTTSAPASDDVLVLVAASPGASTADVTAARDAINTHTDGAVAALATSSALGAVATTLASKASQTSVDAANTVLAAIPAATNAAIVAAHGVALLSDITAARDHVEARGDAAWITATGFAVPGSAMALTSGERATLSGVLGADITTAHGAGSYVMASLSGVATAAALATAQGAIDTANTAITALAGASFNGSTDSLRAIRVLVSAIPTTAAPSAATIASAVWAVALPGSYTTGQAGALLALAGALAPPDAAAIASAVWSQVEGSPASGSYGYGLKFLRMLATNRLEEVDGNPGTIRLYNDNATTVFKTWTLRDGTGAAVTAATGEPARRGPAT